MGLRIHRSSSLPLPLTRLNPEAPATRADLARTISVRATGSSAQLSQESDQDPNPEHHPGSSRKHFMESLFGFLTGITKPYGSKSHESSKAFLLRGGPCAGSFY